MPLYEVFLDVGFVCSGSTSFYSHWIFGHRQQLFCCWQKTFPNECVRTMCVAKNMLRVIIIKIITNNKKLVFEKEKRKKKEIGTATPIFRLLHCSQALISNLCRVNGGICTTRWSHSHTASLSKQLLWKFLTLQFRKLLNMTFNSHRNWCAYGYS